MVVDLEAGPGVAEDAARPHEDAEEEDEDDERRC